MFEKNRARGKRNQPPKMPQPPEVRIAGFWAIFVFVVCLITGGFVCNWFDSVTVPSTQIVLTSDVIRISCAILCAISITTAVVIAFDALDRSRDEMDDMDDKH